MICKVNPNNVEAGELLKELMKKTMNIVLVGKCYVEYQGRASSVLGLGDRIIIIKSDRTILVHKYKMSDPTNWQPPGSIISITFGKNEVIIKGYRYEQKEVLTIIFKNIFSIIGIKLVDSSELIMNMTEKMVYQAIELNPEIIEPGFRIVSQQRIMRSGIVDFSARDRNNKYCLVEVKRNKVSNKDVKQAYKYFSEISERNKDSRGIIVAPNITVDAKKMADSLGLEFVKINLLKCSEMLSSKLSLGMGGSAGIQTKLEI